MLPIKNLLKTLFIFLIFSAINGILLIQPSPAATGDFDNFVYANCETYVISSYKKTEAAEWNKYFKSYAKKLKKKYDDSFVLSTENKAALDTKLNKSGFTANQWMQTNEIGQVISGEKPIYTPSEVGAAPVDHNHNTLYATKSSEHIHTNKSVLDTITQELVESWNNKTELMAEVSDDGILDLQF